MPSRGSTRDDEALRRDALLRAGESRPYTNVLRDPVTDTTCDLLRVLDAVLDEANVIDGDEIEISVRVTGNRPFGDRKVRLVAPHTYEREPESS